MLDRNKNITEIKICQPKLPFYYRTCEIGLIATADYNLSLSNTAARSFPFGIVKESHS
jgi:hypothetical protein